MDPGVDRAMFKRFFFLFIMMAAIGVPYLATSTLDWRNIFGSHHANSGADAKGSLAMTSAKTSAQTPAVPPPGGAAMSALPPRPRQLEGSGARDLAEVIQFDGTPAWVMGRWPRVTAGLAEMDLLGYRVPLVTGTGTDDLAGSLTYYFDKNQRVARISFHGTTGDPRKLIALVTSRYSFLPQRTDDPSLSLYQVNWNGKPQSELRIRTARVLRADQPQARFEIDLAMKRP
jgi:hypothetical protein